MLFANFFEALQKLFHTYENLFSTKRKTFFNEVKIFFHRYENTETKALSLVFTSSSSANLPCERKKWIEKAEKIRLYKKFFAPSQQIR